ncbi:MAG TPA: thiamine pyrophosphate-binding protein [Candidatus Acidoferrales bacterium]|nr:thiamine pyrophosphate-binding protein [Candidatus Acidoferrales bacterium]
MPRMTGSKFFAEAMRAYGVSHLFFMPTIIIPAMAEMEDMNIRRVTTHGEKAAAYMADGYARAAHRPGICLAQNVGAANLAAGLRDAFLANSPVIAITGGPDPHGRYRHVYQEVEDFPMFDPVTKFNAQVDAVERLPDLLRQAFRSATSGTPGPVHLRLQGRHGNVLEQEGDLELVVEEQFASYPAYRPPADPDQVRAAAEALRLAKRPAIVAGGGVIASRAEPEVVALAEKLSIPVATSLHAKATIPGCHPLAVGVVGTYSRWCANRVVAEADLVFFVGSHTGSQVTNNWKIPRPGTPAIQLDIDGAEIGRNYPVKVGLLGDAKAVLRQLIEAVSPASPETEWLRRVRQLVEEWRAETAPLLNSDAVPIRPERICKELTELLPEDAVLVADTGHSGIWTGTLVDLKHPTQSYIRCAGSLGWAFSASIGVKCALPDRPVICFTGDGGFYYHMAELETAARFGVNVVVLVNDNHSLNQEQRIFNAAYGGRMRGRANEMWVYREINLAKVAEAMGCVGIRVERPGELPGALRQAFAAGRPALVDVVTDISALYPRPWG